MAGRRSDIEFTVLGPVGVSEQRDDAGRAEHVGAVCPEVPPASDPPVEAEPPLPAIVVPGSVAPGLPASPLGGASTLLQAITAESPSNHHALVMNVRASTSSDAAQPLYSRSRLGQHFDLAGREPGADALVPVAMRDDTVGARADVDCPEEGRLDLERARRRWSPGTLRHLFG